MGKKKSEKKSLEKQKIRKLKTKAQIERMRPTFPPEFQEISVGTFMEMSQITPEVYLTGLFGLNKENFEQYKINNVINVSCEVPAVDIRGISFTRVFIDDLEGQDMSPYFEQIADNIARTAQRGGHTVVHCMAGVSRSTAAVLAYLIKYKNMTLKDAFNLVHSKRQCIKPRVEFMEQLMKYELKYRRSNSFKMVKHTDNGVTVTVPDFWLEQHMDMVNLDISEAKKPSQTTSKYS